MDHDLGTPEALAVVFDVLHRANTAFDNDEPSGPVFAATAVSLAGALGLEVDPGGRIADADDAVIEDLVARRQAAREAKDWDTADALRDELSGAGCGGGGHRRRSDLAPGVSFRCVLNVVVPLTEGQLRQEWSGQTGDGGVSVLGNRVLRTEDRRMLTEGARYVADLRFDGQAHACFVRSTVAHGRLLSIHADEARSQPGVLGVFTAADLDLPDLPPIPVVNQLMGRPALARDNVRFVGEPVAVVVAETAAAAADGAECVVVEIEPLPAAVSVWAAAEADASPVGDSRPDDLAVVSPTATPSSGLVHELAGTNLAFELPATGTASGGLDFSECDITVEVSIVSQRLAAVPLEPRSAAAEWSADGSRLTFYASTQAPHRVRDALAHLCRLDPDAVRVMVPDVGGGFGAKGQPTPEELLVAVLSREVGWPVVWTESPG